MTLPELNDTPNFLLNAPLYERYKVVDHRIFKELCRSELSPFDGHCIGCNANATYKVKYPVHIPGGMPWANIDKHVGFEEFSLVCSRDETHVITFFLYFNRSVIRKVGQTPSVADISNGEINQYLSQIPKQDATELKKGNGLAAHGVGVGSFVYLRRVFERLIERRYDEASIENKIDSSDWRKKRMDEKIDYLKSHLPEFLVQNKRVYGILSQGIHELTEEQCLGAFGFLKGSILFILEEDKHLQDTERKKKQITDAIASFSADDNTE